MALSGLPLLAASCLAYLSFALRCWGVWACAKSELSSGKLEDQGLSVSHHVQLLSPISHKIEMSQNCVSRYEQSKFISLMVSIAI